MRSFFLSLLGVVCLLRLANAQCTGPIIASFPYQEGFENGMGGWTAGGLGNDWAWGTPNKPTINSAGGGTKSWVTGGLNNPFYTFGERSYVESPCFNFAILAEPYITFKIWWESEQRFDGANFQFSLDAGNTWTNVGSVDDPVNCLNENWFNYPNINNLSGLANVREGWSGNIQSGGGSCLGGNGSGGWVVAKHCMSYLAGQPSVKFRFTFGAGTTCNDFDGVAFDDIYIANAPPIVASFLPVCSGDNRYVFTNLSSNCPDSWAWNFGDPASGVNNTSTEQDPAHIYSAPGSYTVTLIANNICSGSTTAVRIVKVLGANSTITPVSCAGGNDGTAIITVIPGGNMTTYYWNTIPVQTTATATNLSEGTYTVTINEPDACPTTATVTITEPDVLAHTTSVTNALCGNPTGSATVTVNGGTAPYTYNWSPAGGTAATANNLAAGNYIVSITDQHGCIDTAHVTIISTPPIQANITNVINVGCFGENTGSATVNITGGVGPFIYNWSPAVGNAATATGLAAGIYQVTVTDANLCTVTATITLTQPTALFHTTVNTAAACGESNGSATVTETGGTAPYSYAWSPAGGNNATANNLSAGNYIVTVTDANNCVDTAHVNVGNLGGVQATISANVPVSCFGGQNGSATVTASGGEMPYTYIWSPAGGNMAQATGLAAGTYFVTVTDANQCLSALSVIISQPTALDHTISSQPSTCGDPNGSATVIATGGTSPYAYVWSPTGGNNSVANNLAAGSYIVIITDLAGCSDTAQVVVTALPDVQATISNVVQVTCFGGNNGSATIMAASGAMPYTYAWPGLGGNNATATNLSAGTYVATVTDANQCTATATTTITQPTAIEHTITAQQDAACNMATGSATIQGSGGNPPYAYIWSPSGGNSNAATNLLPGNYIVSVTDQSGCTDTVQVTIGNIPGVQASISNIINADCFGSNTGSATVIATVGTPPYIYAWPDTLGNTASANNLLAGNYIVTVTDANNCTATATATISQPAEIQTTVTTSPVTCQGMNGSATITPAGGTSPYTYAWSPTGGNASTASGLVVGNYSVLVTDQQGCTTNVSLSIDSLAGVQASIAIISQISCFGLEDGSLTASGTGGTLPYQYVWSNSGGTGASLSGLAPGSYSVTITDGSGCTSVATETLEDATLVVTQAHSVAARCYGEANGAITVDSTIGGMPPYLYAINAAAFVPQTSFANLPAGNYTLHTQDANGCVIMNTITIAEPSAYSVQVGNDTTIYLGDSLLLAAFVSDPSRVVQYEWRPPVNVTCPACASTFAHPVTSTIYTLYATDANGCVVSDSRSVKVQKVPVFIPNVFAPDSDGENDYFTLYAGAGVEEIELLQIYDRWGALVFENQHFAPSNRRSGWDGYIRDNLAAAGVYAYQIRVRLRDGSTALLEGDVTVVR